MNLELEFQKLREERDNKQELTGTIVGQCQSFCPEYESMDRQIRRDINKFEVILIKKYQRSAAGKTKAFAEDIRPINVLWDVTNYLFTLLNPSKAYHIYEQSVFRDNFLDLYNNLEFLYELYRFIEDRLRAVRLDISAQSLVCDHSIVVLERIVRFYAVFNHLLYHHLDFDLYLNFDQLSRTLADLMDIYSKINIPNPEFVHYFTLTNIKDPALFDDMNIFRKSISHDMLYAYHQNNYHLVFDIFGKFDYLSKCIFLPHLLSVSEKCIRTMKNTINDTVSIDIITSLIPINPEELVLIIEKCGIVMSNGMMDLRDKTGDSKDYQVARSQNPYLEQVRIMNVEMLITNGQVDLVMRNDIIRKYASNLIGRLGVDKTNEVEKEEIVKIDTTNIAEEKRKEKPKKKAKIAKQKPEDVKLDKSKAQASLHTSKMLTNRILHQFTHQLILKHLNTSILHSHVRGHITKWKQLLDGCIKVLVIDNEKSSTIVKLLENENLSVQLTNMSDYKTVDFSDYNFMIFIVENKKVQKTLKEKNKMYNLYVGSRKELETKIEDENFVRSIRESKQIMQQNLSDLVRDKSKDEVMDILLKLRKNKRNDSRIERNINLHKSHRQLVNFVVYYEKGTI